MINLLNQLDEYLINYIYFIVFHLKYKEVVKQINKSTISIIWSHGGCYFYIRNDRKYKNDIIKNLKYN